VSAEGLMAFCRQSLAAYKSPRQVIFVDHLPQTETGKVIRQQVYDLFETPVPEDAD
jgi:acyl-coenzyme A synthetase/AMP-(fatty) acid ligase